MHIHQLYSEGFLGLDILAGDIRKIFSPPPGIKIPFGGGFPAPESFPYDELREILPTLELSPQVLQYGRTAGYAVLQEALVPFLAAKSVTVTDPASVLIGTGSQGLIDGLGRVFLNKSDVILVEAPTFLGALQSFRFHNPTFISIPSDAEGIIPDELEKLIASHKPKFTYLIPTYQNPTGKTLSLERRKRVAEIVARYNSLLIEDDPYSDLSYYNAPPVPIRSLAPDHVIYLGTFSKILSPSFRVGFAVGPEKVIQALITAKEGTDITTSTITQAIAAAYLTGGYFKSHLPKINDMYRERLDAMDQGCRKYFSEDIAYSKPHGGMFLWLDLGEHVAMDSIVAEAAAQGISFVRGYAFYATAGSGRGTMRLNFTNASVSQITEGMQQLGNIVGRHLQASSARRVSGVGLRGRQ